MKTIKIQDETHHKLDLYRVKNKLKTLGEAIKQLLKLKIKTGVEDEK